MSKLRVFATSLFVSVVSLFALHGNVVAQYGQDVYGGCEYGRNCVPETPPTVVDVPPSSGNLATGRVFAVNISEDQVFTSPEYGVEVTPNFSTDGIATVRLIVDGVIVGQATSPDEFGTYHIIWSIAENGSRVIRISMELTDGEVIDRDFNVQVQLESESVSDGGHHQAGQGDTFISRPDNSSLVGLSRFMPGFNGLKY